jgi:hypothetical protein
MMVSPLRLSDHSVLLSSLLLLCNSSGESRNWTVGSPDGDVFILPSAQCTNYTDACTDASSYVPSVHPTVPFFSFSFCVFDH